MRVFLFLLLLAAAPAAASAQVSANTPAGLKLEGAEWEPIRPVIFLGLGGGGGGGASGPAVHPTATSSALSVAPSGGHNLSYPAAGTGGGGSGSYKDIFRRATVRMTNAGPLAVKRVQMYFVFQDPQTGEEVLRIRHASRKRLRPGKTFLHQKTVKTSPRMRRGDGARLRVELAEVVYADGTVWRR